MPQAGVEPLLGFATCKQHYERGPALLVELEITFTYKA
jgi:hypothetical protein